MEQGRRMQQGRLKKVFEIAVRVHGNQVDLGCEPYLFHVLRVAERMEGDEAWSVALLHDCLEDATADVQIRLGVLIGGLCGLRVQAAVFALTWGWHDRHESYKAYIQRIAKNPLAVQVKLADLQDNLDAARLERVPRPKRDRLQARYSDALAYLVKHGALEGDLGSIAKHCISVKRYF